MQRYGDLTQNGNNPLSRARVEASSTSVHCSVHLIDACAEARSNQQTNRLFSFQIAQMGQSPQEAIRNLQQRFKQQQKKFGSGGGGPGRGGLGSIAGIVLIGGAIWTFQNALFNGTQ